MGWLADFDLRYAFLLTGGVIMVATLLLRVNRVAVITPAGEE